jgi:hypothetical protein
MFNIRQEVEDFFKPFFQSGTNRSYLFNYGIAAYESWTPDSHIIPSTGEVWLAGADYPDLISDLYIGYSAAELICFVSQRPYELLKHPQQQAFAAIGLLPTDRQVQFLKAMFPFARWHLLFGPDPLGKIADAGIGAWYKGYAVSFRINDSRINIKFRGKAFNFDSNTFSLHRFEQATGLRAGIRTHKPPHGLPSFTALQNQLLP